MNLLKQLRLVLSKLFISANPPIFSYGRAGAAILLVAFIIPVETNADTVQSLFDKGNQKLKAGYYKKALQYYHTIEEKDTVSGPLFLNMGILYTHLDSLGKAKYYLLKARSFPTTRKEAKQGLKYVNDKFSNQSAVLPKLPWDRVIDWLNLHWGVTGTFLLGIFLLLLAVGGIIYAWFFEFLSQSIHLSSRILTALGIFIILLSLYMNYVNFRYDRAVMISGETVVKQKPIPKATTIGKAYEGYTFTVDLIKSKNSNQWYYVRLPNGMHGWIQKQYIKIL